MANREDAAIIAIAEELRHYIKTHPRAADSLEGVAKWWLARQRYEQAVEKVERALDYLVAQGDLSKHISSSGGAVYTPPKNQTKG